VWSGRLQLLPVLIVALVSAVAGDNFGYWLGRRYGRATVERYALIIRSIHTPDLAWPGRTSSAHLNASHAARCVACHGARSHAVPVALVGECPIPVV